MNYSRIPAVPTVLWALAFLAPAHAEQMYVIDKVVLNVFPEPNTSGRKVAALETGDTVEVIDELEPYAQVRLADGRVGWVRANFLTKQAPAILRLKELQSAQSTSAQPTTQENPSPQLLQELGELKQQNAALQGEVTQLRQEVAAKPIPAPLPARPAIAAPPPQAAPAPVDQSGVKLWAWVAAVLAGGALGFLLGYQTLATHIKRKYGNIKIY